MQRREAKLSRPVFPSPLLPQASLEEAVAAKARADEANAGSQVRPLNLLVWHVPAPHSLRARHRPSAVPKKLALNAVSFHGHPLPQAALESMRKKLEVYKRENKNLLQVGGLTVEADAGSHVEGAPARRRPPPAPTSPRPAPQSYDAWLKQTMAARQPVVGASP